MALLVLMVITVPRVCRIRFRRDAERRILGLNISTNLNSSIGFITYNHTASQFNALKDVYSDCTVINITRSKEKSNRIPKGVNYGVYFGISPSARESNVLIGIAVFAFFCAPAEC